MSVPEMNEYLGDGVYASWDGYHIWLAANDHRNKVVALDPQVVTALGQYVKKVRETMEELRKAEEAHMSRTAE